MQYLKNTLSIPSVWTRDPLSTNLYSSNTKPSAEIISGAREFLCKELPSLFPLLLGALKPENVKYLEEKSFDLILRMEATDKKVTTCQAYRIVFEYDERVYRVYSDLEGKDFRSFSAPKSNINNTNNFIKPFHAVKLYDEITFADNNNHAVIPDNALKLLVKYLKFVNKTELKTVEISTAVSHIRKESTNTRWFDIRVEVNGESFWLSVEEEGKSIINFSPQSSSAPINASDIP